MNPFYADPMFLLPWEMPSAAIRPFLMAHEPSGPNAALCHLNVPLANLCPPHLVGHAWLLLSNMRALGKHCETTM